MGFLPVLHLSWKREPVNGLRQQFDELQFDELRFEELRAGADMVAVPSLRAPGIDLPPGYSSQPVMSSNRSTEFRSRVRRVVFHAQGLPGLLCR
jgi:hypothetical protein